jgi:2-methylisocitrate lyase-like PEP mutase family enzyme
VRLYEHAGADVAFIESPWTKDEMRTLVRELAPHPVLINVLPDVNALSLYYCSHTPCA